MFHANAWGYPYLATMFGAKIVYPGSTSDPESLLDDFVQEGVTVGGRACRRSGWASRDARREPGQLGPLEDEGHARRRLRSAARDDRGVQPAPRAEIVHGWGMTETSPVASRRRFPATSPTPTEETQFDYIALQGLPLPLVELARARRRRQRDSLGRRDDGRARGARAVGRRRLLRHAEQADRWTDDGWFKTGDIVSFHPRGFIHIQDRSKDVIKSGGEWISSVELENALMGHPAIAEAAVIAVPHEKWDERRWPVVVLREGQTATAEELCEFLAARFAKWWVPDYTSSSTRSRRRPSASSARRPSARCFPTAREPAAS
jgi:fatty-acyl-CoA synthase